VPGCRQGVVNMHLPERWAYLQFANGPPGAAALQRDPHWTLRTVAVAVYDAQAAHAMARSRAPPRGWSSTRRRTSWTAHAPPSRSCC